MATQQISFLIPPYGTATLNLPELLTPDAFARLADEFARLRDQPWTHFGADTNYPPTKAKPAVWEKPAEFEQRRQAFAAASERLLAAAAARNEGEARSAYAAVQDSCKACHNDFRK